MIITTLSETKRNDKCEHETVSQAWHTANHNNGTTISEMHGLIIIF